MMMKIENQVCTIEQAQKLKELGIAQESFFSWAILELGTKGNEHVPLREHWGLVRPNANIDSAFSRVGEMPEWWDGEDYGVDVQYAAFTSAELMQMLPNTWYPKGTTDYFDWDCRKADDHGRVDITCYKNGRIDDNIGFQSFGKTPFTVCLAHMAIWALEKKLITAEQCNKLLEKE